MDISLDQEAAIRQRYIDIDDKTEDCRDCISLSVWNWQEFQEMYDISWIFHENGLEGVVLTYPEIKSAVDNKIISDVSLLPAYEAIKTQKWCIDQVREKAGNKRAQITIPFLKEMHGRLVIKPEDAGVYRKDIPIHRTYFHEIEQPAKIHNSLGKALDFLKSSKGRGMHPIEWASAFHHRFMRVFPFSKHSGFIGRLLLNFVLMRHGYLPAVIHAADRQRYYEALRNPERDFRKFVIESMDNALDNATRFFSNQAAKRGA